MQVTLGINWNSFGYYLGTFGIFGNHYTIKSKNWICHIFSPWSDIWYLDNSGIFWIYLAYSYKILFIWKYLKYLGIITHHYTIKSKNWIHHIFSPWSVSGLFLIDPHNIPSLPLHHPRYRSQSSSKWAETVSTRFARIFQALENQPPDRKPWITLIRDICEFCAATADRTHAALNAEPAPIAEWCELVWTVWKCLQIVSVHFICFSNNKICAKSPWEFSLKNGRRYVP